MIIAIYCKIITVKVCRSVECNANLYTTILHTTSHVSKLGSSSCCLVSETFAQPQKQKLWTTTHFTRTMSRRNSAHFPSFVKIQDRKHLSIRNSWFQTLEYVFYLINQNLLVIKFLCPIFNQATSVCPIHGET